MHATLVLCHNEMQAQAPSVSEGTVVNSTHSAHHFDSPEDRHDCDQPGQESAWYKGDQLRELFSNITLDGSNASEDSIHFSIWDMAGQTVFYDLQQLLLTRYSVYLVCFSLVDIQENEADCLAYIRYWLQLI